AEGDHYLSGYGDLRLRIGGKLNEKSIYGYVGRRHRQDTCGGGRSPPFCNHLWSDRQGSHGDLLGNLNTLAKTVSYQIERTHALLHGIVRFQGVADGFQEEAEKRVVLDL
ncbi:MAG: hypothetical protein WCL44_13930, partial [bacterium]